MFGLFHESGGEPFLLKEGITSIHIFPGFDGKPAFQNCRKEKEENKLALS